MAAVLTLLFQNCSPQVADNSDLSQSSLTSGNSSYRLPATLNQQFGSSITCTATVSAPTVAAGASFSISVTPSGALPPGFSIAIYGTKDGVVDAWGAVKSTSLTPISDSNSGYQGGSYTRSFQILDSTGRAICQTPTVAFNLQGTSCTLSTANSFTQVGQPIILNIAYGSSLPSGAVLTWDGTNNGVTLPDAAKPYGATNTTQWIKISNEADRGIEFVRYLNVMNSNGTLFCISNAVRFRVD